MIDDETFQNILANTRKITNKLEELNKKNKQDRFVLEEDISRQEDINDHLNLLIEDILDNTISSGYVYADDIVNTLQGIINIHELRTHKLWEHFKIIFELDEYRPCNSDKNCYNPDKKVDPFDPFKE